MNYFCEGLSQPNILSFGFTAVLSHPPLCSSDWLRDIEERGTGKKERERVRQCYSLSAHTHCEAKSERPGRGENASAPLTPHIPAPHSTLNQLSYPLFQKRSEPGTITLPLRTEPHSPDPGGGGVLLGGCFDRSWLRRSVATRSRLLRYIPSVRC